MKKNCLYCDGEFEPKKPKQIFCSSKCRVYYGRINKPEGGIIYCLRNPLSENVIFYVGKTLVSLDKRLEGHLKDGSNEEKATTIQSIIDSGQDVIIEQLEVVSGDSINELEALLIKREKYWINELSKNSLLTNKAHNLKKGKTNPIGVRFNEDILEKLKTEHSADTPQKALNFLERFFETHYALTKDLQQPLRSNVEMIVPPTANKILDDSNKEIQDKIAEIEKELKSPPKNILIGERTWRRVREQRIQELKNQLK